MSNRNRAGAAALATAIARAGLNPNALATATGGAVSATTVRAYLAGGNITVTRIGALAEVLGAYDLPAAVGVLRAYGLDNLADRLAESGATGVPAPTDPHMPPRLPTTLTYSLEDSSESPFRHVPIGWQTRITMVATLDSSHGLEMICVTESGTLLMVRPLFTMEVSPDLLDLLNGGPP